MLQTSRIRREATDAQIAQYAALTAELPKLLVTGAYDRVVPPIAVETLRARLGEGSSIVELPSCGHISHEETAPQLLAYLVDFISDCLQS